MGTKICGIASSQSIDSSGEIVDIAGLDISTLATQGVMNWAHKNDSPSQVIGKILEAKKIFSEKDCEDDSQKRFWNKCKTPFVYIVGELFDEQGHSQAKDVAAMFRYDAEKNLQNDVLGFSVEGSVVAREGNLITRSIARKVTVDPFPCNKQAIAEVLAPKEPKIKDVLESLFFKSESFMEIEIVKKEDLNIQDIIQKAEFDKKTHADKLGIEPKGAFMEKTSSPPGLSSANVHGTNLGSTSSGKPIHSHAKVSETNFNDTEHQEAAAMHQKHSDLSMDPKVKDFHAQKARLHAAASKSIGLKNKERQIRAQAIFKAEKTNENEIGTKFEKAENHQPKLGDTKPHLPHEEMMKLPKKEHTRLANAHAELGRSTSDANTSHGHISMKHMHENYAHATSTHKTIPGSMGHKTQNSRDRATQAAQKMHSNLSSELNKAMEAGSGLAAPSQLAQGAALAKESLDKKMKKSKWLTRTEEAYNKWEKREQFETFMKSRMPHMTSGEVKAIGHTLMSRKSLKKMVESEDVNSAVDESSEK